MSDNKDLDQSKLLLPGEDPIKAISMRDIRSLAFHFIYAAEQFNYEVDLNTIVEEFEKGFHLEIPRDSYAITVAEHTINMREQLDDEIKPFLQNWKLERLGLCTRLILRMALWELIQPDAIPSVIINEAIELAKSFAEKDAYKFINGILDELVKKRENESTNNA